MYWHPVSKDFDELYRLINRSKEQLVAIFDEESYRELLRLSRIETRTTIHDFISKAKDALKELEVRLMKLNQPLELSAIENIEAYGFKKEIDIYLFESARKQIFERLKSLSEILADFSLIKINATKFVNSYERLSYAVSIEEIDRLRDSFNFSLLEQCTNIKVYYSKFYIKGDHDSYRVFYETVDYIDSMIDHIHDYDDEISALKLMAQDIAVDYMLQN